jgi:hypothetical protein
MQHKDIKAIIKKQLKTKFPNWKRLNRKKKKSIARKVLGEVVASYDFTQPIQNTDAELLGIEWQRPVVGIKSMEEMAAFIEKCQSDNLFRIIDRRGPHRHILDKELQFIDRLIDDRIINRLLSYDGYTPAKREFSSCQFLRAELLKAVKYPEISYRKFCGVDYMGKAQKQNRAFMGLSLNTCRMIDHTQLSHFRNRLTFAQMVNLMVYVLYHFKRHGFLGERVIYGIDSTELAVDTQRLLASIEINGKKIRIYEDIDCDCGKRRNKRDKSVYVVGYRMHTLTAIDPGTGRNYPLISLLSSANHHDSQFYFPLIELGRAIGLEMGVVTADEAYSDREDRVFNETGVCLVTPPKAKALLPRNVDQETLSVTCHDLCETPMEYMGVCDGSHEYRCQASKGECFYSGGCPGYRFIPIDSGYFQRIRHGSDEVSCAIKIRKNSERAFNLLKHREGLEKVRVRSCQGIFARCTFTTMVTLMLEMADTRRKKVKKESKQLELFAKAA